MYNDVQILNIFILNLKSQNTCASSIIINNILYMLENIVLMHTYTVRWWWYEDTIKIANLNLSLFIVSTLISK